MLTAQEALEISNRHKNKSIEKLLFDIERNIKLAAAEGKTHTTAVLYGKSPWRPCAKKLRELGFQVECMFFQDSIKLIITWGST